jgi:DNA-binding response OmpR family regulator
MKKVLIIEDDRKIATALAIRLKAAGFESMAAYDAITGLSLAIKSTPDVVLLDISIPAGSGFLVAERIQTLVPKMIPIIFITASKQPGLREKAEAIGAVAFLEKPFENEQLISAVRAAASN